MEPLLVEAVKLHEQGDIDAADNLYRRILDAFPYNAHALHFRGVVAVAKDHFQEGIAWIGRAIAQDPYNASYYSNLGEAYRKMGDLLTALNLYRLALLIDPNLPSALMNAGIVCTSLAQYPRALALFQQCLQMGNVDDLKVVLCMAVTYIESGDLERAHSCFVNVLRQDPHNEEALHGMQQLQIHGVQIVTDARVASLCNVASAAKSHGLFREAAQHVAKAYKLAPRDANLALNLALLHECMGNTALAAETLTRRQAQVSPEAAASIAMEKLVYLYRAKYEFLAGALDSVMSTLAVINQYGMAAETSEDMAPYRTERVMCSLIAQRMSGITMIPRSPLAVVAAEDVLHIVGDSHVLSYAWVTPAVVAHLVTGLKAWHVQKDFVFITAFHLRSVLARLASTASRVKVLLVAGEIDCRWEEGIGSAVRSGVYSDRAQGASTTVHRYLCGLQHLCLQHPALSLTVLPVLPPRMILHPAGEQPARDLDLERAELVVRFNDELRKQMEGASFAFRLLDIYEQVKSVASQNISKEDMYLDQVHLNPLRIWPIIEKALS